MRKLLLTATAALVSATALSACGSSSSSGKATSPVQTNQSDSLTACKTQAAAAVTALRAVPKFAVPDTTIDASKAAGKSVWVINVVDNELITSFTKGIQDASKAMGMSFHKLTGAGTTQSSNAAVNTALGAGASAIVMDGIDPATVTNPLQKAKSAGVPVITIISSTLGAKNPLIYGDVTVDEKQLGSAYADYALAQTGCKLQLGSVALPKAFTLNYALDQATHAEVARLCPSCTVKSIYLDLANLATATPTQVQSLLKANPGTNYLALGFDAVAPYVGPAASALKPDIHMIGNNGLTPNMKQIIDGGVQNADMTYPPNQYVGWLTLDKVLSALSGGTGGNTQIPLRLVDKTNIGDGDLTKLFPTWAGYQDAFLKHWGK